MNDKNINKNSTQSGRKEHPECSADTKLFFDDVYKSGTRGKKQQVDVLQYGRSMIEMLGVLAIVGVLSVGGIAGYSKAMEKFKINKTIDEISHIVANIRTLYSQQTTYDGLYTDAAIKMGVIPDSLTTTSSYDIINSFGGEVRISPKSKKSLFDIAYLVLSKSACVALASYDWGDKSSSGLIGVAMSNSNVYEYNYFNSSDYATLIEKGCHTSESGEFAQVTCIGQQIPLSSTSSICNCNDEFGCSISLLYQ